MPLPLLSHIFPIFLTINMGKLNKMHISTLLAKGRLSHTEEASHQLWFLFFFIMSGIVSPSPVSPHSTQRVWNSPSYHVLSVRHKMALKLCLAATGRPGWKAISGEMDTHINILTGCFVKKKGKKKNTRWRYKMQWNRKKGRRKERRRERRGNIHQINTSVALIVISPPWRSLRRARQAAKRDLSMQS